MPLFVNANILPINFVYFESLCCLMHDIRNGVAPVNIINLFTDTSSVHSHNTRSSKSNKFYIKNSRLEIQNNAFSRVGARVWNELPESLREFPKKQFKMKLHKALFDNLSRYDDYIDISQISTALKNHIF